MVYTAFLVALCRHRAVLLLVRVITEASAVACQGSEILPFPRAAMGLQNRASAVGGKQCLLQHPDQLLSALPSEGSAASSAGFPGRPWWLQSALSARSVLSDMEKWRDCPWKCSRRRSLLFHSSAQMVSVPFLTCSLWQEARLCLIPALTHPGTRATPWPACLPNRCNSREGRSKLRCPLQMSIM